MIIKTKISFFSRFFSTMLFIHRLEKEYTTIKNKEMEEQIEIKVGKPGFGANFSITCRLHLYAHVLSNDILFELH